MKIWLLFSGIITIIDLVGSIDNIVNMFTKVTTREFSWNFIE